MPLTRRGFSLGLSSAICSIVRSSFAHAATCTANADTRIRVIDVAHDVTNDAPAMRAYGVSTVIRYYTRENGEFPVDKFKGAGNWVGKAPKISEMRAIGKAGLAVAVVFQFQSANAASFRNGFKGEPEREKLDAEWALNHAKKLEQPPETPIYFGADFNLQDETGRDTQTRRKLTKANEDAIKRYFTYIANELGKKNRKVGVYGCGATCRLLRKHGLAEFFWISESMSYLETDAHYNKDEKDDAWHLYQNKGNIGSPFPSKTPEVIDTNVVNDQFDWFGQWDKDGKPAPEPKDISTRVLGSRRFVRTKTLCLKTDLPGPELGSAGLLPKEQSFLADPYARTVRVLCDAGDYVGVSLVESDKLLGYCKKAHLTDSMRTMPPWAAKSSAGLGSCG